jgi:hypothetical protein
VRVEQSAAPTLASPNLHAAALVITAAEREPLSEDETDGQIEESSAILAEPEMPCPLPEVEPTFSDETIATITQSTVETQPIAAPDVAVVPDAPEAERPIDYIDIALDFIDLLPSNNVDQEMANQDVVLPGIEVAAPTFTSRLAESLATIDPEAQQVIAPVLVEIIAITRMLQNLEADQADSEDTSDAMVRLEALCVVLFEMTGIVYEPQEMEQFIQMLVQPDRTLDYDVSQVPNLDLTKEGTREGKHFNGIMARLTTIEDVVMQNIGMVVLFGAGLQDRSRVYVAVNS